MRRATLQRVLPRPTTWGRRPSSAPPNSRVMLVALARSRGVVLATAESCTGGLVSSALTSVPGSSACVAGGVVSYLASVKESVLSVPAETIEERDGVVSSQTAEAMARGVCERLGAGLAVEYDRCCRADGRHQRNPGGYRVVRSFRRWYRVVGGVPLRRLALEKCASKPWPMRFRCCSITWWMSRGRNARLLP